MNAPRAQKLKQSRVNATRAVSAVPDPELGSGAKLLACIHCRTVLLGFLEHLLTAAHNHRELLTLALAENSALLAEIRHQTGALDNRTSTADSTIDALRIQLQASQAKAEAMQMALEARSSHPTPGTEMGADDMTAIRAIVHRCRCSVPQILAMIASYHADRVVVLDSARRSAEAAVDFHHPEQAADLLIALVTTYRNLLVIGRPESDAKQAFGYNKYAAGEGRLSRRGEQLRTFSYRGEPVFMGRHLKLGVGEKSTTGLRIHFHWDAERQVVVIGHCGAHLDFI